MFFCSVRTFHCTSCCRSSWSLLHTKTFTQILQQEGSGFKSQPKVLLHGLMFSAFMHRFSQGTPDWFIGLLDGPAACPERPLPLPRWLTPLLAPRHRSVTVSAVKLQFQFYSPVCVLDAGWRCCDTSRLTNVCCSAQLVSLYNFQLGWHRRRKRIENTLATKQLCFSPEPEKALTYFQQSLLVRVCGNEGSLGTLSRWNGFYQSG